MGDETLHYLTNVALMTCQNISNNARFTDCRQMRRMSKLSLQRCMDVLPVI